MIFEPLSLPGAFVVDLDRIEDDRGFFARAWSEDELRAHGLTARTVQCNLSYNARRGTVRGMHYQAAPHEETKYVRCTRGSLYDVIVDLRPGSATYLRWTAVELSSANRRMLCVPEGFAHGFQTLEDDTEVYYHVSEPYAPRAERGARWDDPAFAIDWPAVGERTISEKDAAWPDYRPGSAPDRPPGT